MSRQALDRAGSETAGQLDTVISAELGAAAGEQFEQQVINGSGSNGQTKGILNWSGITSTTYTDALPTVAELCSKLGSNYSSTATADGRSPDLLVVHPRRWGWLKSQAVAGEAQPERVASLYEGGVVQSAGVPSLLGSSTSEDRIISLRSDAVKLYADSRIRVLPEVGSGTLTVRFQVVVRVALIVKAPTGVGVLSGSGLAAPSYA